MHTTSAVTQINEVDEGQYRKLTFRWILDKISKKLPSSSKLVDLGAGPCIFAKIAVEYGFNTTAVDGRVERLPEDMGVVRFVQSNVTEFDVSDFDVVANLGLLYHLTLDDQIRLMNMVPKQSILVLDTQVHIPSLIQLEASRQRGFEVDNLVERNGYSGVLFPEVENPMASIGNKTSWWHTEESLMMLLENSGFESAVLVGDAYVSKYGGRRWIVASKTVGGVDGTGLI